MEVPGSQVGGGTGPELEYGYFGSGVDTLLEEVKAIVLTEAATQAQNATDGLLAPVVKACEDYWEGTARVRYVNNLKADASTFANALNELYSSFETEVRNAGAAYKMFDEKLFEE